MHLWEKYVNIQPHMKLIPLMMYQELLYDSDNTGQQWYQLWCLTLITYTELTTWWNQSNMIYMENIKYIVSYEYSTKQ